MYIIMTSMIMIISTYPDKKTASDVAQHMVREGIAACVNITEITSVYTWNGEIENTPECIAIFKATEKNRDVLKNKISQTHPYQVPEIAEIDITSINQPYLNWLTESTAKTMPIK